MSEQYCVNDHGEQIRFMRIFPLDSFLEHLCFYFHSSKQYECLLEDRTSSHIRYVPR